MDEEKSLKGNRLIITTCLIVSIAGLFLILQPYLSKKKSIVYETLGFQIYENDILYTLDNDNSEEEGNPPSSDPNDEGEKPGDKDKTKPQNNYIGSLEISKINLKKGFVNPSSKYNNIKYNVTILKGSNYPDVKNGNFILIAHSGTGALAFFKDLYKLRNGDTAVVTYNGKKYTYKINKIYTQKKQGYLTIYRNVKKTTLTLITCTKDNNKSQTVYIAELIGE